MEYNFPAMQLTLLHWLLALAPVLVILVLMLGFHWGELEPVSDSVIEDLTDA